MPKDHVPQLVFEQQLKLEAQRVLDDFIFQRAPVQSRLLQFLVERTLSGRTAPSQYEIAVDGLGKDGDYDVENDSYPRVQISRLRRNLENYYARNLPLNGLRIRIASSSYRIEMLPLDGSLQNADESESPVSELRVSTANNPTKMVIGVIIAFGILTGCLILAVRFFSEGSTSEARAIAKPYTVLRFDENPLMLGAEVSSEMVQTVRVISELQLRNSFVSNHLDPGQYDNDARYLVDMNFGPEDEMPAIFVTLSDQDGNTLYFDTISLEGSSEGITDKIEASLVYITSPTGAIAQAELKGVNDATSSGYSCFLSIENLRSEGTKTSSLVNECLDRYPNSEFRSFWFARRAFATYQMQIRDGNPVQKSGPAWDDLRNALQADRFNAFANFVAAKVELAEGNCPRAQSLIDRSLERGASYPILVAAAEASALSCTTSDIDLRRQKDRLLAIAQSNLNPDPLLHVYLMIGLLATEDRGMAASIADRLVIPNPDGLVEITADTLRRALNDRDFAKENRPQLETMVRSLVWNDGLASNILELLEAERPGQ
ncbi:hypothetical protein [Erythrobacter ani]|uniref:Adenylate cyclase n=1 Tax=Erythrobacter ani TaxID=2827235 RepID=A0ABS6SLR0_9SPHN|nr:hypothetical protein [Erythrobacter ani]MBV7265921.1 hypothetical protein [Erythrobacter ani]